ncbi:sirohydrochlorin chelatase [Trichothermofontia sp.]
MIDDQCQERGDEVRPDLAAGLADLRGAKPSHDHDLDYADHCQPAIALGQATAILLITHGSPDPRAQEAAPQLTQWVRQAIAARQPSPLHPLAPDPGALIGLAYLEQAERPLYEQICQFGAAVTQAGYNRLQLFPLFLLPGLHVMEDIPAALRQAQRMLGKDVNIELRAYLGAYSGLVNLLQTRLAALNGIPRILLAHGSRLAGAQQRVAWIAQAIQAHPAYLTELPTRTMPDLATCLRTLPVTTTGPVAILPYALFEGKMTAAIASQVMALAPRFPHLQLHILPALGTCPDLASLIATAVLAPPEQEVWL